MPKGIKGFQIGHNHSETTKKKIGLALRGIWIKFECDYCNKKNEEKISHYKRKNRHFCNMKCYALYRKEIMPKEEQPRFGKGESIKVKMMKLKCRSDFNHYLRDKKIERQPCEICGDDNGEGHHPDYNRPLEVHWLCRKHHRQIHKLPNLMDE